MACLCFGGAHCEQFICEWCKKCVVPGCEQQRSGLFGNKKFSLYCYLHNPVKFCKPPKWVLNVPKGCLGPYCATHGKKCNACNKRVFRAKFCLECKLSRQAAAISILAIPRLINGPLRSAFNRDVARIVARMIMDM